MGDHGASVQGRPTPAVVPRGGPVVSRDRQRLPDRRGAWDSRFALTAWLETEDGWWGVTPTAAQVDYARAERAARDELHPRNTGDWNSEHRWMGHLGEVCLQEWLELGGIEFDRDGGINGLPDFTIRGHTAEHKNRSLFHGRMRPHYVVNVPRDHLHRDVELYVFTCYEAHANRLLILGAIAKAEFMPVAAPGNEPQVLYPSLSIRADVLYPPRVLRNL